MIKQYIKDGLFIAKDPHLACPGRSLFWLALACPGRSLQYYGYPLVFSNHADKVCTQQRFKLVINNGHSIILKSFELG